MHRVTGCAMFNNVLLFMWRLSSILGPSAEVLDRSFSASFSLLHLLSEVVSCTGLRSPLQPWRITAVAFVGRGNYTTCHVGRVAGPMGDLVALITFLLLAVEEKGIKWDSFLNKLLLGG